MFICRKLILTNNFKALENAGKQIEYLKVLEKSLNLNLQYVEILHLHLITILKQTVVFISPVLELSTLAHLTDATDIYCFTVDYKQVYSGIAWFCLQ